MMKSTYIVFSVFFLLLMVNGCKKENKVIDPEVNVINPYDSLGGGQNSPDVPVDSSTFLGLHQYIFSATCAVPACHDGSFEPDFRTVQSTYSTLVLHKPLKNDDQSSFDFRVDPGNSKKSWLYERITTDDAVLGRMPLYDNPLSSRQIQLIADWIDDGAPDLFGNKPNQPNPEPAFFGILAYVNDTAGMRIDTTRENVVSAMIFPQNSQVNIWFGLYDSDENNEFIPAGGLTYNKIKISSEPYGFENITEQSLTVESLLTPFMGPIPVPGPPQQAPYYHHITINTSNYQVGRSYYMRIYVKDADNPQPTELPDDGSQYYLLSYFSFIVR